MCSEPHLTLRSLLPINTSILLSAGERQYDTQRTSSLILLAHSPQVPRSPFVSQRGFLSLGLYYKVPHPLLWQFFGKHSIFSSLLLFISYLILLCIFISLLYSAGKFNCWVGTYSGPCLAMHTLLTFFSLLQWFHASKEHSTMMNSPMVSYRIWGKYHIYPQILTSRSFHPLHCVIGGW